MNCEVLGHSRENPGGVDVFASNAVTTMPEASDLLVLAMKSGERAELEKKISSGVLSRDLCERFRTPRKRTAG